jgi:protein-export membrane protein SecD
MQAPEKWALAVQGSANTLWADSGTIMKQSDSDARVRQLRPITLFRILADTITGLWPTFSRRQMKRSTRTTTPLRIFPAKMRSGIFAAVLALGSAGCGPKTPLHGTAFVVGLDTRSVDAGSDITKALGRAPEALKARLAKLGIPCAVQQQADGRLLIKVPELKSDDLNAARRIIARPGMLAFRLVHPNSDDLIRQGVVEPGYELFTHTNRRPNGIQATEKVLVSKHAELTGSSIKSATAVRGNLGTTEIMFTLTDSGTEKFAAVTRDNVGRRLAIILDGELYSAPVIRSAITGGRGQITGDFSEKEAIELANVLENSLDVPLQILEEMSY